MLLSKTPITRLEANRLACDADEEQRLIGFEFAKEDSPQGTAYWKYFAVKKDGKLYIIEVVPNDGKLEFILGIHV